MPIIPRHLRKEPVVVVKSVKNTDKAKAAAAVIKCRQILVGTEAFQRHIKRLEALEDAGWTWK